jgi:hypothetical protein
MKTNSLKVAVVTLAIAIPMTASAQPPARTPQKYCTALDKSVDRYITSDHGANHLVVPAYGKAACKEHDPADAIPVLERTLEASRLPLPPHPASVALHRPTSAPRWGSS